MHENKMNFHLYDLRFPHGNFQLVVHDKNLFGALRISLTWYKSNSYKPSSFKFFIRCIRNVYEILENDTPIFLSGYCSLFSEN